MTKAIREIKSTIKFNIWKLDLAIKTLKKHANEDYKEVLEILKKERDENDEAFKSNKLVPELEREAYHVVYRIDTTLKLMGDITAENVDEAIRALKWRKVKALNELANLEA